MKHQRVLIAMMDGFGPDYFQADAMPVLSRMAAGGLSLRVRGMFPSVTNVNNVSIATGEWPAVHGISANSRFDPETGTAVYLNSGIKCPSVFGRAKTAGVKSLLLTSKRKTRELFAAEASIAIAAEDLSAEDEARYGKAPPIYSREINWWLWETAERILAEDEDIGLAYVHITDYPMHAWGPERAESREHLARIDAILGRIVERDPGMAVFVTADHGMNSKKRCWDLTRLLEREGCPARFVLSPERDFYVKHHRNYTGCAWVWLRSEGDRQAVKEILGSLEGVEAVEDGRTVAETYNLDPSALGDLVVMGDKDTMFGDMDGVYEDLPEDYRAHGSLHEMDLPLVIWNWKGPIPEAGRFTHNKDLAAFLYR